MTNDGSGEEEEDVEDDDEDDEPDVVDRRRFDFEPPFALPALPAFAFLPFRLPPAETQVPTSPTMVELAKVDWVPRRRFFRRTGGGRTDPTVEFATVFASVSVSKRAPRSLNRSCAFRYDAVVRPERDDEGDDDDDDRAVVPGRGFGGSREKSVLLGQQNDAMPSIFDRTQGQ